MGLKKQFPDRYYDELVPEGVYQLRIVGHRDKVSSAGNPMTRVDFRVEGTEAGFHHYLVHPTEDSPSHENERRCLMMKRFWVWFGVEFTSAGFDTDDLWGAKATCKVTQEKGKDGTIYNRVQIPRLKADDGG